MLLATIQKNSHHLGAAVRLLEAGEFLGLEPAKWYQRVHPPRRLDMAWKRQLFMHYAQRGMEEHALAVWESLEGQCNHPYSLVKAAEMFDLAGERETGIALIEQALRLDGALGPVRRRLAELRSPTSVDKSLIGRKDVVICLFSWNKAAELECTLRSLAASHLGRSKVRLLLNGCTDDSRSRALAAAKAFKDLDFELIDLPVNVGVAPARNWLLSLPEVQKAEYVVFADDDILVPADWLEKLLRLAESDSRIGVVGGKVVYPAIGSSRGRLQYLYRIAGLTLPGLFKLSQAEPGSGVCDSGLYSFTRPCLSVMGCLILLNAASDNTALKKILRTNTKAITPDKPIKRARLRPMPDLFGAGERQAQPQTASAGAGNDRAESRASRTACNTPPRPSFLADRQ